MDDDADGDPPVPWPGRESPSLNKETSSMDETLSSAGARTQAQAVIDPNGQWHPSISAAAFAHGLRPSSVSVLLKLGRKGWRYAGPEQPASASAPSAA